MIPQTPDWCTDGSVQLGILSGGRGRRLGGRDKAALAVDGELNIARLCQALPLSRDQMVVNSSRNPWFHRHFAALTVADLAPERGPLAGIAALLAACQTRFMLVLPCDLQPPAHLLTLCDALVAQLTTHDLALAIEDGQHSGLLAARASLAQDLSLEFWHSQRPLASILKHCVSVKVATTGLGKDYDDLTDLSGWY